MNSVNGSVKCGYMAIVTTHINGFWTVLVICFNSSGLNYFMRELLLIYIFGFLFELMKSIHTIYRFQWLKRKSGIDMFAKDYRMQSYLIRKPFLWPWFFVTEKSPIERLSESLFKNYGDEGHIYTQRQ